MTTTNQTETENPDNPADAGAQSPSHDIHKLDDGSVVILVSGFTLFGDVQ